MENLEATIEKIKVNRTHNTWHRMNYGRIPYSAHYMVGIRDFPGINEKCPAIHRPTPNLGGSGKSLSIWIHKSVPRKFIEFVLYHELVEAELAIVDGIPLSEAHKKAVVLEELYAEKFYGEQRLAELRRWRESLTTDNYQAPYKK